MSESSTGILYIDNKKNQKTLDMIDRLIQFQITAICHFRGKCVCGKASRMYVWQHPYLHLSSGMGHQNWRLRHSIHHEEARILVKWHKVLPST